MKRIRPYLIIFAGVIFLSAGISLFCVPNKIVSGGVSGISTVFLYLFGIPVGFSYYALNILLLIAGAKKLGKRFVLRTLASAGLVALFTQIFSYLPPLTNDRILSSLFGGAFYGIGIGLNLVEDSSTGGTDIAGRLIQKKFSYLPIGSILLGVDLVIISLSFFVFKEADLAMYGILSLFVSSAAIDIFIRRLNEAKIAFVVTEKGDKVARMLTDDFGRGVTSVKAKGVYTGKDKMLLICALMAKESGDFTRKVKTEDKNAFIAFSASYEISGNGFYVYR